MRYFDESWEKTLPSGIQWPFHLWKTPFFQTNHTDWVMYCAVGEYKDPLTVCGGQVWPTYGVRKSVLQMFVIYSCFHLLLASWPSHSVLDLVFCLCELQGRNIGLQQLEEFEKKKKIKLLADKNIFQISGPIKPKDHYVHVLDHFSFDTSMGTGL